MNNVGMMMTHLCTFHLYLSPGNDVERSNIPKQPLDSCPEPLPLKSAEHMSIQASRIEYEAVEIIKATGI